MIKAQSDQIIALEKAHDRIVTLEKTIEELRAENRHLQEQLDWLKKQIFGKKSERIIDSHQQLMFEGFETIPEQKEEKQTIAAHKRQKRRSTGEDAIQLPDDLPVETIILDLPEKEKICKETGVALKKIGEEVSCKLAHRPGSYFLKQYIPPKYAHPQRKAS